MADSCWWTDKIDSCLPWTSILERHHDRNYRVLVHAGNCWPAVQGGGPAGTVAPHKFMLYFREGGVGTFLHLYYR